MSRRLKYRKGPAIETIFELVAEILNGAYVIWHNKRMHPGWMRSQQLGTLVGLIRHRVIFYALPNEADE